MGRTIAIGDIHGCHHALTALLKVLSLKREDLVVALGDYVDRGENSAAVLDILIGLLTNCRFVPLIGNHEIMMFQGLNNRNEFQFWMQHGGSSTIMSYGGDPRNIPQDHLAFLSHCVRFHETDKYIFVHANYDPWLPMTQQPDEMLFWQHILDIVPTPHDSGKTVIAGHTPQADGLIRNLGHVMVIDTFCYGDQWLTAVDLDNDICWQANNRGEVRRGQIPVPVPS